MINQLAQNFISYLDKNGNGKIEKSEYEDYLKSQKMPLNMASNLFSLFNKDGDGSLSQQEMFDGYTGKDKDNSGNLEFNEMLALQNQLSNITIDTSTTATQYNSLYSNATNFIKSADIDGNGEVSLAEYQKILWNSNYDKNDAAKFVNYFDKDGSNSINILEFQSKMIQLDADNNGKLDTAEYSAIKNLVRPLTSL